MHLSDLFQHELTKLQEEDNNNNTSTGFFLHLKCTSFQFDGDFDDKSKDRHRTMLFCVFKQKWRPSFTNWPCLLTI